MSRALTENVVEEFAIGSLAACGSEVRQGTELGAAGLNLTGGLIDARVKDVLERLNSQLSHDEREHVLRIISRPPHPSLIENNRWFHGSVTDGVPVEYRDAVIGETRGGRAALIDFDIPANNDFLVVQQLTIAGADGKTIRPDLVLFVNGLPLVVIELKDPANTTADLDVAIDQLGRYKTIAPDLFVPNLLLVASDGLLTRVGSITSGRQRFTPWRPARGGEPTLEALIRELLNPAALLDYLQSCVTFEEDERGNIVKKVAGYHQFRAVRKARASVIGAIKTPDRKGDEAAGKGGVVWHTQGSGKSLTMLMLAGTLVRAAEMANPTVVIVTDRNDLDDQLFDTFAMGRALLRQDPV
jgi:type I restriction enzyme R subunit